jgi:hypothetical protein
MVERALTSGAAATAGQSMRNVGKQTGAILEKGAKALDAAGQTKAHPQMQVLSATPAAAREPPKEIASAKPASPPVTYEDAAGIKSGMEYDEVVRRFCKPALSITGETGQTLLYQSGDRSVEVDMRDGKVGKIR